MNNVDKLMLLSQVVLLTSQVRLSSLCIKRSNFLQAYTVDNTFEDHICEKLDIRVEDFRKIINKYSSLSLVTYELYNGNVFHVLVTNKVIDIVRGFNE